MSHRRMYVVRGSISHDALGVLVAPRSRTIEYVDADRCGVGCMVWWVGGCKGVKV
jgi:hypothetical protein